MSTVAAPVARGPRPGLLALLIAVVALYVAHPVVGYDFVAFDDDINIVSNPHLGPPSGDTLAWMWTDVAQMRRYVPVGWMVFSTGYALTGLSAEGYHVLGVGLHALNALLIFAVLRHLLGRYGNDISAGRRDTTACLAALLWACHPMRGETIGWCSGLLYATSGAGALGSVWAYLRGGDSPTRARWVALSWGLFALSVLAYPMSMGLVGVFIAIDLADWRLRGEWSRRRLLEKGLLAIPAVASALIAWGAAKQASTLWPQVLTWGDDQFLHRVGRGFAAAGYYLWHPWWPVGLTPTPSLLLPGGGGLVASGVVLIAAVAVVLLWRRFRWAGALLLLAHLALLAPLLGWTEEMYFPSDRYGYLSGVVLVAGLAFVSTRLPARRVGALGVLALALLAALQHEQLKIWRDTPTLMARVTDQTDNALAKSFYTRWWVNFHTQRGEWAQARDVVALAEVRGPAGVAAEVRHAFQEAESQCVPGQASGAARAHHRLALDFSQQGRASEAENHFRAALRVTPQFGQAAFNFALFLLRHGRLDDALAIYSFHVAPVPQADVPTDARRHLLGIFRDRHHAAGDAARAAAFERALGRLSSSGGSESR